MNIISGCKIARRPSHMAGMMLALGFAAGLAACADGGSSGGIGGSIPELTAISVAPGTAAIEPAEALQFTATGSYSDGSSKDLTTTVNWSSGNTSVATVDANGLALGVTDGTASITAIDLDSGLGDNAALTVNTPVVLISISLTPPAATIAEGATQPFTATGAYSDGSSLTLTAGITWDSSDTAVATVDTSGRASAVAEGATFVSATDNATGIQGTATLTVVPPDIILNSISVTPASSLVTPGTMVQFTATGNNSDGTSQVLSSEITWSSDNEPVATVDAAGLATTLIDGTATISATDDESMISGSAVLTSSTSSYFTTTEVAVASAEITVQDFTVDIPVPSWGIGIVAQGVTTNFKVIDHGQWIITGGQFTEFITDPSGAHVPLSFALIDLDADGTREEYAGALFNHETASVFFPNDGSLTALPAGTYTFPVAAINAGFSGFETDTVQPYVFYKTGTETQTTMKLNIWVPSGVGGIMTAMDAQNDPEIQGAIAKIREIYETDADVALNLAINVDVVPDSSFAILDDVAEWWDLNAGYPTSPTHDAMNIFVVSAIAFQPLNVIGLAPDITGPFSRQGTIISGTLAEYQGDGDGTFLGVILAHEFGHYLGLYHTSQTNSTLDGIIGDDVIADTPNCTDLDITIGGLEGCPDAANYMFPIALGGLNQNEVSTQQGLLIRLNPAVTVP